MSEPPRSEPQPAETPVLRSPRIERGDPVPWIDVTLVGRGRVNLEQFAGLRVALVFLASVGDPRTAAVLHSLLALYGPLPADVRRNRFVVVPVVVTIDMKKDGNLLTEWLKVGGLIHDDGLAVHAAFGMTAGRTSVIAAAISDESLTIRDIIPFTEPEAFAASIVVAGMEPAAPSDRPRAPVMTIPDVLSPEECRRFIDHWRRSSPFESGYMMSREDGKQYEIVDRKRKSRADIVILPGSPAYDGLWQRFEKRVHSLVKRYWHFTIREGERFAVAAYTAETGGHFAKHRDFAGPGSHREFAVTINLNDDFEGGELEFPEFPGEVFKPAVGAAIVYSGAHMHRVRPVTRGTRFALLAFLMGTDGARTLKDYVARFGGEYDRVTKD